MRRKIQAKKEQATISSTYIIRRTHWSMGVKGSAHRRRLLQMFGSTRRGTLLNTGFWQLHYRSSLLRRRFIGSKCINKGSSGSIPFRALIITRKSKNFALVKRKKMNKRWVFESARLTSPIGQKFQLQEDWAQRAPGPHSWGAEVLEERSSSTCFLFLSRLGSSECAGGGDIVELLSSSKTLASSPSWLLSASGALEVAETGSA
jgi:hypothetical protein